MIPRICPTLQPIPTVSQSWCNPVVEGDWFLSHSRVVPHNSQLRICQTALPLTPQTHDDRLRHVLQALRQDAPQGILSEVVQGGTPQMLHRQARAAQILIQELSRRVGSVPGGSSIPRIVREQRWSPVNVPLMWAAAGQDPSTPVLDWLILTIANSRDQFLTADWSKREKQR